MDWDFFGMLMWFDRLTTNGLRSRLVVSNGFAVLLAGADFHFESDAFVLLDVLDYLEEVVHACVVVGMAHALDVVGRLAHKLAKLFVADGGVDGLAQRDFSNRNFVSEEEVDCGREQKCAKFGSH